MASKGVVRRRGLPSSSVCVVLPALFALATALDASEHGKHIITKGTNTAPIGGVLELTPENFASHVAGEVSVFVKFYAPWCGHCKRIAPVWSELAFQTLNEPGLKYKTIIANVNADEHEELAREYEVKGFPTFVHFPPGNTSQRPMHYNGGQTVEQFIQYLRSRNIAQLSSKKNVNRVFAIDMLAWKFRQAKGDADLQADLMQRVKAVIEKEDTPETMRLAAEIYVKMMEKSLKSEDFDAYFETERDRLDRLIRSGQLSDDQVGDVTARRSIIDSFITESRLPGGAHL